MKVNQLPQCCDHNNSPVIVNILSHTKLSEYLNHRISIYPLATMLLCYATLLCYYAMLLCYAMLCYAMPCYAMPCHAMLCYAMLCYAMLCYAMLCYTMQRKKRKKVVIMSSNMMSIRIGKTFTTRLVFIYIITSKRIELKCLFWSGFKTV